MKGLLRLFSLGDACVLLSGLPGKHVEKYQIFRELLASNRTALRALAEMELLYYSGQSFTIADVSYRYEQLFTNIRALIRSLNILADHRYAVLDQQADTINGHIKTILTPTHAKEAVALVLSLQAPAATAGHKVGGKAANLARIGQETGLPVPAGFVVTTAGYERFLQANRLDQMILDELAELAPEDPRLAEVSKRLADLIAHAEVPEELVSLLHAHYDAVAQQTDPGIRLAMRSSAVREDSEASFAGQYRSVLNVTKEHLAYAYKSVIASSFSPRAIAYRQMMGIEVTETPMCVLGLAMIEAAASGVLYTADPSGDDGETMLISAVLGLGEQLVDGSVTAESLRINRQTGAVDNREIAVENSRIDARGEGVAEQQVAPDKSRAAAISDQEAKQLALFGASLEQLFGGPQDIEWALDPARNLSILQCRPLQVVTKPPAPLAPPTDHIPLINKGIGASYGIATGRVYVVSEQQTLAAIPDQVVLVTRTAAPRYAEIMGRISGLITEVGSLTCHLASVAREFGVPMAVDVTNASQTLASEEVITLYAQAKPRIYRGRIDSGPQEKPPTKRCMVDSTVHQRMRAVLDHISPLHLTNPEAPNFTPEHCASLHDLIRFAHEQAVREMFNLSDLAEEQSVTVKLATHIPLTLHLIDLGGGLQPGLTTCNTVTAEHFISEPIKALWRGFTHPGINWSGTVQFDNSSFLARMAASATAEFGPEPGGDSYALIGTDYLNLSAKFGYHFATLDTLCSEEPDHNYLSLQFSGGAGNFYGKTLRIQFLGKVLSKLGCTVHLQGELLEATLNRFPRAEMLDRLDQIGRLLASSRLLDMAIANQEEVETMTAAFINGHYDLLNRKENDTLLSFYTHLGYWRQTENDGRKCCLSDGSPWVNSLASGVSNLITKTFGRSYQELMDNIGAYYYFPLAIAKRGAVGNADISVRVQPVRGSIDQAGGLVFGLRDIGNYFVFRINALEDNAMLFEFINNRRFKRAQVKLPITKNRWYVLKVSVQGQEVSCQVDGEIVVRYQAERVLHGHVGLWTKADSVTLFNDLVIDDGIDHSLIQW